MRIAIYGAGSLGIILGAYLAKAGLDVELVNRNRDHVHALREKGATVVGKASMNVPVKAVFPNEMEGPYDVVFLLTKQLNNAQTAAFLKPLLSPDGVVCTLQNGIPEPELAEILGKNRVLGGTVAWGATLKGPGVSELTSDVDSLTFGMGGMEGTSPETIEKVKEILEKMCPVEVFDNFQGVRWTKLLTNAAFSGMGTVIGGTFGDAVDNKKARRVAQYVIKECIDTGHAAGVTFAPVQGKDIVKLFYFKGVLKRMISFAIIPAAMKKHRAIKPSMLQDIEKGKPCEVEAINGAVCRTGRKFGAKTPFNDRIVDIIKKMERKELVPSVDNLRYFDDLL
ncbi:MAG: ketopantoate reductase family protein [Christensenellales bacterium]|jgi:2-dehydropantoate 2-reductase